LPLAVIAEYFARASAKRAVVEENNIVAQKKGVLHSIA